MKRPQLLNSQSRDRSPAASLRPGQPTHGFSNTYRQFDDSNIDTYFEASRSSVRSPAASAGRAAQLAAPASSSGAESDDDKTSPVNRDRVVEVDLSNLDAMVHEIQLKKEREQQKQDNKLRLIYELECQE